MSRITGTDAFNMMEAYNAVYTPQELTEDQVWEEVENWVNSLVEEGYDLSEYTWEDMYEAYLNEMGQRMTTGQATRPAGGGMGGMRGTGRNRSATQTSSSPGALRVPARPQQGPTDRPGLMPGLSVGPGGFNINNRPVQTTPTRPAATAPARPAATAPARPAATAPARPAAPAPARPAATVATQGTARPSATPATTTTPAATTTAAPAAPQRTFNPLMQRTFGYQTGYAPSQIKQDPKKMAVMGSLRNSFDPFDIVQGYLIDEGYAETEEAAAVIMANMSEEWRESILEGVVDSETLTSDQRRRKRNDEYRSENPTLPSGNPMGPNAQLMRQMAHAKRRGKKAKKD